MSPSLSQTTSTSTTNRRRPASIVKAVGGTSSDTDAAASVETQNVSRPLNVSRRVMPTAGHVIDTDTLARPWSVLTTHPFANVAVDAYAGHLLIDLQSTDGNVRMQLTRRHLPVTLKMFIDAIGQLAAASE